MRSTKNLLVLLSIVIISGTSCDATLRKRRKLCHINQLVRCSDPLLMFTAQINSTGIVTNQLDFHNFCSFGQKYLPKCIRKWIKRCGNRIHSEIVEQFYLKPFLESAQTFCDPNGEKRKRFLKHSPCLHSSIKLIPEYRQKCVQGIQAGFEFIHSEIRNDISKQFQSICCVYNRWQNCIKGFLIEKCGSESDQIIVDLISSATSSLFVQLCPLNVFDPQSQKCMNLLPPEGTKAKGFSGHSYLSYMFSYWCPNVGYGIIPEKD